MLCIERNGSKTRPAEAQKEKEGERDIDYILLRHFLHMNVAINILLLYYYRYIIIIMTLLLSLDQVGSTILL